MRGSVVTRVIGPVGDSMSADVSLPFRLRVSNDPLTGEPTLEMPRRRELMSSASIHSYERWYETYRRDDRSWDMIRVWVIV